MDKTFSTTKRLTAMAMMAAIAFVITLICHFVMPPLVENPPLKLNLMDVIIVITGFMMGALPALYITVVVAFIEMLTISSTGIIGFLMNMLQSAVYACTAAFVYKKMHSKNGALWGLIAGSLLSTAAMILWNWLITPLYMGIPRSAVEGLLIPAFLPFNLLKAGINSALALMLYKPVVSTLRQNRLLPESESGAAHGHFSVGLFLIGAVLLVTCVLFALALSGVI
jgi:riboflavin transporter FmnP